MRMGVSVVGCLLAATVCGCGGGVASSHAQSNSSPPASPTATSSSTAAAEAPLPKGYIRLHDTAGFVSLGVPHSWYHARLDASDPALGRLTRGNGPTARRWKSFATTRADGGVFAASDPLSADTVLVVERHVGVDVTDLGEFDKELRAGLGKAGVVSGSTRIEVGGRHGLRYLFEPSGAGVHEVLDFFDIDGTVVDLTFTGAPAAIAAVTATVHFPAG